VRATNAAGSADSAVNSVTTPPSVPTELGPPTVTAVRGRHDQLVITWSAPHRPNGIILHYTLQRNESTPWNLRNFSDEAHLQYVDDGLLADTIYSYTVSACTSAGCTTSVRSTARTNEYVPSLMLPPAVTTLNSSTVQVSWTSPATPNGRITLYRLLLNATSVYSGLTTTQLITGLNPYVWYEFVVSACTSVGCTRSAPTLERTDEALPTDLAAPTVYITGARSAEISWSPPAKPNGLITAYELRRNNSLIQLTTDTWYVDYDCSPGTTYSYQVSAYNSIGRVDSPATSATTFSSAPEGLRPPHLVALSSTDVAVSWQAPAVTNGHIVNYTLYMAHDVVYTGLTVSTVVRDLSPWTSYSFRVSACTINGCTVSRDAQVTTPEAPPSGLGPPRLTASVIGQVLVEWSAPRSPNGVIVRYELYRRAGNHNATQGLRFILVATVV